MNKTSLKTMIKAYQAVGFNVNNRKNRIPYSTMLENKKTKKRVWITNKGYSFLPKKYYSCTINN